MWSKEVPVDDGENTGIDANGSRESRDDDERKDRVAADEAETVPEVIEQAIEKSSIVDGFGDFAGQGFGDRSARSGEMEIEFCCRAGRTRCYSRRTRIEMVEFERVHFQLFEILVQDARVEPRGASFSPHPPDAPEQKCEE